METNPSGGKVPSLLDRTRCEPFRLLVAAREVALFLYKKVDTCPFTNIIEGKAVKPYLSQFHSLVGMKRRYPYHKKARKVDGPLFAGGGILFVVKKLMHVARWKLRVN